MELSGQLHATQPLFQNMEKKKHRYPLNTRLGGPQNHGLKEKKKSETLSCACWRNASPFFGHPTRRLVTRLTELSQTIMKRSSRDGQIRRGSPQSSVYFCRHMQIPYAGPSQTNSTRSHIPDLIYSVLCKVFAVT